VPNCPVTTTLRPVAVAFIVFGFFAGAFAVATFDIERTFHLTDAGLGALLAAGVIAATALAAIGGAVTDRFGARRTLTFALIMWGGLLALEGGRITVENCDDGGARFTIIVPAEVK